MSDFCEHGYAKGRRCVACEAGDPAERRSVYEDRPVHVVADEDWRAEQLRSIGIPYGWEPLEQRLRRHR